jgi:hypothetical protein
VSQVPVSQFLTSQPLEDGTDCEALAVTFLYGSAVLTFNAPKALSELVERTARRSPLPFDRA